MGIVLTIALLIYGISILLALYRLVIGPTLADRAVAMDLLAYISIGFAIVYAIYSEKPDFLDVALVLGLIAFLGTVAFARYIERAYVAEGDD